MKNIFCLVICVVLRGFLLPINAVREPKSTHVNGTMIFGFYTSNLPDLSQCWPLRAKLMMQQDFYFRVHSIICVINRDQLKPNCSKLINTITWSYPAIFTLKNIPLHFGGNYELSLDCNQTRMRTKLYLLIVRGYPEKPEISYEHGNGRSILTCKSTLSTQPSKYRLPVEYTWIINNEPPESQGYRVEFADQEREQMVLMENQSPGRCEDVVQCIASERTSALKAESRIQIDRQGLPVEIKCSKNYTATKTDCRLFVNVDHTSTPHDLPLNDHIGNKHKFQYTSIDWSVSGCHLGHSTGRCQNSSEIELDVKNKSLHMVYYGNGRFTVNCTVVDGCNKTKFASTEVTFYRTDVQKQFEFGSENNTGSTQNLASAVTSDSTSQSPLYVKNRTIPVSNLMILLGSLFSLLLIGVLIAVVCIIVWYVRKRTRRVIEPETETVKMRPMRHSRSDPTTDIYDRVRESQLIPTSALIYVRSLRTQLRELTGATGTSHQSIGPDLPARDDTYDRPFSSETGSTTDDTSPPERPPTRQNRDGYKHYVQTSDFKDHIYEK